MVEELKNFANIGIIRSQSGCTLTSHSASGIDLREKTLYIRPRDQKMRQHFLSSQRRIYVFR